MDDNCIVCLTTNSKILSRINSKSREWQECSIQRIIEKHLWWWYSKQLSCHYWICRQCWQELLSFHIFFTRVEKAHRQYELLNLKKISLNMGSLNRNEEFQTSDDFAPLVTNKRKQKENSLHISRNVEFKLLPAMAIQDDKVKTEPLKEQDYVSLNCIMEKNTDHCIEEIESKRDMELLVVKEEFEIYENSLTAINTDLSHLDTSEARRQEKSIEIKDLEASFLKNSVAQCLEASKSGEQNKEETKKTAKNVQKQLKLEITRINGDYLDKSGYKYFCHLCKMSLSDFRNLKTHYRLEHNIVGYAVCCNKKFYNRGTLADHLRVHEDPNYFKCQSCGKIMSNRISFETHMAYHKLPTSGLTSVFNCDKCDKIFLRKAAYNRHIFLHVPEEERKFQCEECNKKFGSEHLVKLHKTFAHLKKYCKICEICGKSFRERFSFKRHMDEHNGKPSTKVPCDICGVKLTNKYLLNRHKKFMHTEENQQEQICPHCSKVSPNMAAHRQHIFYNHTLERKHACHICEKKFKLALKLKEHLSTHTGEPLFTCPFCPQTFISKTRMYKHRKDTHPKEWQEVKQKTIYTP